ncbi:hypothetical protein B0I37DRAFT_57340 [Chaetomium sp. MPI-CAGE-AT-0009]|nr:hypothetical protein B0I37DRAFT_57340 [Chaetomium sp. MPI-CAGE-AT-0009]
MCKCPGKHGSIQLTIINASDRLLAWVVSAIVGCKRLDIVRHHSFFLSISDRFGLSRAVKRGPYRPEESMTDGCPILYMIDAPRVGQQVRRRQNFPQARSITRKNAGVVDDCVILAQPIGFGNERLCPVDAAEVRHRHDVNSRAGNGAVVVGSGIMCLQNNPMTLCT